MADTRNLERHRSRLTWQVVVEVPRKLRPILGRRLKRSTESRDLKVAQYRRHAIVAEFHERIEAARRGEQQPDTMRQAWALRDQPPVLMDTGEVDTAAIVEEAERVERREGTESAQAFAEVASGKKTPLSGLVDTWLSEAAVTAHTKDNYKPSVEAFIRWCGGEAFAEDISRRKAGEYVTGYLAGQGQKPGTINKKVSALSSFWTWLERRGYAEDNPWPRQSVPVKADRRGRESGQDTDKRAFTDGEISALLTGTMLGSGDRVVEPDQAMLDMMKLLALTGMRREEVAQLKVGDVEEDGFFSIREGKSRAAIRRVPIHSELQATVKQRTSGKKPGDFLLEELGPAREARGDAIGKRFTRYRRKVGVEAQPQGERASLVDMHSFRRWFSTKARHAGQMEWVVGSVVGHQNQGMTFGVYAKGDSDGQLRACVEAVQLPKP